MKINFKNKKVFVIIVVFVILLIILFLYIKIINKYRNNNIFAKQSEKYSEELSNPVFRIEKILIYSDANIEDLSKNENLSDINISQFTDFAIYIDNKSKTSQLTAENTINNIYIDNITISALPLGTQKVSYKSIDNLCKYEKIDKSTNRIDYEIIHKNSEKNNNSSNSFYTDCSEPLIVSYTNENIVEHKDVSNAQEKLSLDGSILKYLGIELESLNYQISFRINIENNLGENFFYNCKLDINLDSEDGGIYTGYIMQIFDLTKYDYRFIKRKEH